jgi:hypothetical protein
MSCKACQSLNRRTFSGELAIHFPGIEGLDMPIVWVFPRLEVCLECGFAEFEIPESELRVLAQGAPSACQGVLRDLKKSVPCGH